MKLVLMELISCFQAYICIVHHQWFLFIAVTLLCGRPISASQETMLLPFSDGRVFNCMVLASFSSATAW